MPAAAPSSVLPNYANPERLLVFNISILTYTNVNFPFAVKHCVKLRTQRGYRESNQSVVLSGADLVRELAHVEFLILFHIKGTSPPPAAMASGARLVAVTEGVMQKITGLESVSPTTLAAEVELPELVDFENWRPGQLHRLLALERCQDPGNLGTLLRTALALGWDGVFLLPGCADHFNDKAMRASRGACFKLPIASGSLADWKRVTEFHSLACIAADLDRTHGSGSFGAASGAAADGILNTSSSNGNGASSLPGDFTSLGEDVRVSLVLGSEGQGLSESVLQECTAVSIPMIGDMESLNVAAAGAIFMWALSGRAGSLAGELSQAVKSP
jgi:TrmH family RNA methyltransferase